MGDIRTIAQARHISATWLYVMLCSGEAVAKREHVIGAKVQRCECKGDRRGVVARGGSQCIVQKVKTENRKLHRKFSCSAKTNRGGQH